MGIKWELDLREGIDFSIFLLGGFELRTLRLYRKVLHGGQTIIDVGANIGAHTLPFAKIVGKSGKVIAVEPTQFGIRKLRRNIELNSDLASTISVKQLFLSQSEDAAVPAMTFSGWPLTEREDTHLVHGGRPEKTDGAIVTTLDELVKVSCLKQVDFLKIDVDGCEAEVLFGGLESLSAYRPTILMEWSPYIVESKKEKFSEIVRYLKDLKYEMTFANSGQPACFREDVVLSNVPHRGSANILLRAPDKFIRR